MRPRRLSLFCAAKQPAKLKNRAVIRICLIFIIYSILICCTYFSVDLNANLRVQSYKKKRKWKKFSIFAHQKKFKSADGNRCINLFCGVYRAVVRCDVAVVPQDGGQRCLFQRAEEVAVAGCGLRHDRGIAFGRDLSVGAGGCVLRAVHVYAAGIRVCVGLCGDSVGVAAVVL